MEIFYKKARSNRLMFVDKYEIYSDNSGYYDYDNSRSKHSASSTLTFHSYS